MDRNSGTWITIQGVAVPKWTAGLTDLKNLGNLLQNYSWWRSSLVN